MPEIAPDELRRLARRAVEILQAAGHSAFWAGGCVRDHLLNRDPKDYDIATSARPEQVAGVFPGSRLVGKSFGVVLAPVEDVYFEVATFREDADYRDGRRPESVRFSDAGADARRRDFTVNAMFLDPVSGMLLDYIGGRPDLDARLIRCVGDPSPRFQEDHLRMLRAVRLAMSLEFTVEPRTADALRRHAALLSRISAERVRDELTRILLESRRPGDAVLMLEDFGLLQVILPEVAQMRGQAQPVEFHPEGDVLTHTVLMLNGMSNPTVHLAYAVLLHDVGKPPTARMDAGRLRFERHAAEGSAIAEEILRRLKFPARDVEAIAACVRRHMRFADVPRMKESTLRKLLAAPTFPTEMDLHRLDCLASHRDLAHYDRLIAFREKLADEPVLPARWVTGRDLLAMGVPEGPMLGRWLKAAYDAQLDQRFPNRESLIEWLRGDIFGPPPAESGG